MLRMAILISGRGSNMEAILEAVGRGSLAAEAAVVLSNRPEAAGLERAHSGGIPTLVVPGKRGEQREDYGTRLAAALAPFEPDILVLAGFMVVLSGSILKRYHGRIVNIHPSLLPAFPGAHAHRDALEYGVKMTGCTVHFVDEGVDSGPIILQEAVPVLPSDSEVTLAARVLEAEHRIYPLALQLLAEGRLLIEGRHVKIRKFC